MDHIAIMNKKWRLIPKILDGSKTIESRWYVNRIKPWDNVKSGDRIYFKDAGEPVTVRTKVSKVLQFEGLNKEKFEYIMDNYAKDIQILTWEYDEYYKSKKYCILVFLKDVESIEPFNISKEGFGNACAWMCVDNIDRIKI